MSHHVQINLPADHSIGVMGDFYNSICRSLGDIESALAYINSTMVIQTRQKYTALCNLIVANPGCAELSTLHELYLPQIYQLPDADIYILFKDFPEDLSQEQLTHWMSFLDHHSPYQLTGPISCPKETTFLVKLRRLVGNKKLVVKLLARDKTLKWSEKWRILCRLTRGGSKDIPIKDLPVFYFKALVKDSNVDFEKLRKKLLHLMNKKEKKLWDRIVGRRRLLRRVFTLDTPIFIAVMVLSFGIYSCLNFMEDKALYKAIGAAIVFVVMRIAVLLNEYAHENL